MTVEQLITELSKLPKDAQVDMIYDGSIRSATDFVFLTNAGDVAIGSESDYLTTVEEKPKGCTSNEFEWLKDLIKP